MGVGPDEYRSALRRYAGGITVVTVAAGPSLHGMTASSFASVSLEPPLILVSLSKSSRTRALVTEGGGFAVNVLGADQETISRSFSKRGMKPFDSLPYKLGADGIPLIDGAIAWLECRVANIFEGGDHDIVVGEVVATEVREGTPLIYYDGAYRSLAHPDKPL